MLQEIIQQLEAKIAGIQKFKTPNCGAVLHNIYSARIESYRDTITLIRSKLPEFEEAIKKAVTYGNRQEFYDGSETLGQDYYNQNYKK